VWNNHCLEVLSLRPSNIKIQRAGAEEPDESLELLPTADLGRWMELAGVEAVTLLPSLAVKAKIRSKNKGIDPSLSPGRHHGHRKSFFWLQARRQQLHKKGRLEE
jgi:hypothetical protein